MSIPSRLSANSPLVSKTQSGIVNTRAACGACFTCLPGQQGLGAAASHAPCHGAAGPRTELCRTRSATCLHTFPGLFATHHAIRDGEQVPQQREYQLQGSCLIITHPRVATKSLCQQPRYDWQRIRGGQDSSLFGRGTSGGGGRRSQLSGGSIFGPIHQRPLIMHHKMF